jgi:hypothetical protein
VQEILVNASGDVKVIVDFASVEEGGALHCDELNGGLTWEANARKTVEVYREALA